LELVDILLGKLADRSLTQSDQLILVTQLRKLISSVQEPPIKEILTTPVLDVIHYIFSLSEQSSEEVKHMKLEAIWIVTNLAYGD